jgi:bifunctional DNA-binding transcriptional regulator/antitoxin component of YhaV-PrlF toxin-antitoxin module
MNEVFHTKVSNEGRIAIPAVFPKQIGLQTGQEVILKVTLGGLPLTS